jgi:hypothetical protein
MAAVTKAKKETIWKVFMVVFGNHRMLDVKIEGILLREVRVKAGTPLYVEVTYRLAIFRRQLPGLLGSPTASIGITY